ncbi:MAG: NADPH:quinone oxidoreductase family protein [Actinomycetota bacterium]
MQVVVCRQFGPLDDLVVEDQPAPECGPGGVRLAVGAAGVNFVDGLLAQGQYQLKPPVPYTPGSEIAGRVDEVGDDVEGFAIGDRVFASTGLTGGFAGQVVVPAFAVHRTPDAMTDGQAASFTQSYMTARFALERRAQAAAGQQLLVLGAGGGIGLAAVDVGRAMGLRVIAAASSDDKRQRAIDLGADAVVDSRDPELKNAVRAASDGGVDLAYDPVGGAASEQALRALRDDGQLLILGFAAGEIPRLPANQILLRNRRVTGVDWGGWTVTNPLDNRALLDDVIEQIARGELHPTEPTARPLTEAAAALRDQVDGNVAGKTVLVPG